MAFSYHCRCHLPTSIKLIREREERKIETQREKSLNIKEKFIFYISLDLSVFLQNIKKARKSLRVSKVVRRKKECPK